MSQRGVPLDQHHARRRLGRHPESLVFYDSNNCGESPGQRPKALSATGDLGPTRNRSTLPLSKTDRKEVTPCNRVRIKNDTALRYGHALTVIPEL